MPGPDLPTLAAPPVSEVLSLASEPRYWKTAKTTKATKTARDVDPATTLVDVPLIVDIEDVELLAKDVIPYPTNEVTITGIIAEIPNGDHEPTATFTSNDVKPTAANIVDADVNGVASSRQPKTKATTMTTTKCPSGFICIVPTQPGPTRSYLPRYIDELDDVNERAIMTIPSASDVTTFLTRPNCMSKMSLGMLAITSSYQQAYNPKNTHCPRDLATTSESATPSRGPVPGVGTSGSIGATVGWIIAVVAALFMTGGACFLLIRKRHINRYKREVARRQALQQAARPCVPTPPGVAAPEVNREEATGSTGAAPKI